MPPRAPAPGPLPLNFALSLAASRIGLPAQSPSPARLRRLAESLRRGARYDVNHDVQCLGYGLPDCAR
ncbi:MAG: hypothetical protein R3E53_14205 [Myxococcota bacterium]